MKIVVLLLVCVVAINALSITKPLSEEYQLYCKQYGKTGTVTSEETYFKNVAEINKHNAESHSYQKGINQFSAMTEDQRKTWKGSYPDIHVEGAHKMKAEEMVQDPPASWDWRARGAVNPVKDQEQCGVCWAFASTGAVESAYFIDKGQLVSLSESQQADCDTSGGCNECAFKWLQTNRPCTEGSYPYQCPDSRGCRACSVGTPSINRYSVLPQSNETALKAGVYNRPVAIGIAASGDFMGYSTGIFSGSCPGGRDHAVILVGYGTDNGQDYWILRNSWSASWGEAGYMRIARGGHGDDGICLLATDPSVPFF